MKAELERFLESPALSEATRRAYRVDVAEFCAWLERRGTGLDEIDVRDLLGRVAENRFHRIAMSLVSESAGDEVDAWRVTMAIDRAFIAHGTPIWVDTNAPVAKTTKVLPWRQLLIAQDTGAGILGAVRGDIYWGDDAEAAELGGRMGGPGKYWLLLPRGVAK